MILRELFALIAPSKLERVETLGLHDALHDSESGEAPLLVRAFSAIGTWIGATLIAMILFALEIHQSGPIAAVLSLGLFAGAFVLARRQRNTLVMTQVIWVLTIGAQMLLLGAADEHGASSTAIMALWTALNLATMLLIRVPSLQLISAALAVSSATWLAVVLELPWSGLWVVLPAVAVATSAWVFEVPWAARLGRTWPALAYGLPVGVIVPLIGGAGGAEGLGLIPGEGGAPLATLAIVGLIGLVLGRAKQEQGDPLDRRALVLGLVAVIAGLAAREVPGLALALLWLLLAHLRKSPGLQSIALVQLGGFLFFFYYQLETSLLLKSLWVVSTGVVLLVAACLARLMSASPSSTKLDGEQPARRRSRWLPAIVLVLVTSGIVVAGAVSKERIIARGTTVLLPLVPVDPRSLMQGDYMTLGYALQHELEDVVRLEDLARRGVLVITLDGDEVGHFARVDDGSPLRDGELRLEYRLRDNGWSRLRLGAESFFFAEGSAAIYETAQFGELAVAPSGKAVLIGLRDEDRQPLGQRMHTR